MWSSWFPDMFPRPWLEMFFFVQNPIKRLHRKIYFTAALPLHRRCNLENFPKLMEFTYSFGLWHSRSFIFLLKLTFQVPLTLDSATFTWENNKHHTKLGTRPWKDHEQSIHQSNSMLLKASKRRGDRSRGFCSLKWGEIKKCLL